MVDDQIDPPEADQTPVPTPPAPPTQPTAPTPPETPPAAAIVASGRVTEQTAALAKKLKAAELRAMELEQENFELRQIKLDPPKPLPGVAKEREKKTWLDGVTFFED